MPEEHQEQEFYDEEDTQQQFENEDYEFQKFLIIDRIPKELRRAISDIWVVNTQSTVLSNLSDSDIRILLNQFDTAFLYYIMNKPQYAYTFEDELIYTQLRMLLLARLKRAKYGFERKMLASSIKIQELKETSDENERRGGLLARFFGFR